MARPLGVIQVRLSESAQAFMAATLDLLQAVANADPALVTDEILDAATRLTEVVEERSGEL